MPAEAIINARTLRASVTYLILVPAGVWLGIWLNRRISEDRFVWVIYTLTFLAGVELIVNFDLAKWVHLN